MAATEQDYIMEMEEEDGVGPSGMEMEDPDTGYLDDEYLYEDEIMDPKERVKKESKNVPLPAKEKRLGGKKAYKEYMESMKNQKRQQPINPDDMPLKDKIKKIFKNDHRFYGK
eukprot:sb/3476922/